MRKRYEINFDTIESKYQRSIFNDKFPYILNSYCDYDLTYIYIYIYKLNI